MNNARGAGSLAQPVDQQSRALPLYHGCPHCSKRETSLYQMKEYRSLHCRKMKVYGSSDRRHFDSSTGYVVNHLKLFFQFQERFHCKKVKGKCVCL